MVRSFLHKVFVEDAVLKVFSLCLSIALFVLRSDLDAAAPAYVRVSYSAPADKVLISDPTGEVKVVVRGPFSRASRFVESELAPIQIDLSKREDGELRFSEEMLRLPSGLRVASFTPPAVFITTEARVERTLPVQVVIEGEPQGGYRLAKVLATPRTVRVSGARTPVEALRNAQTRPLRVTGLASNVEMTVKLAAPPRFVKLLDSPEIAVAVELERVLLERTYSEVQIKVQGSSPGSVRLQPDSAAVVLRGPALALEQLGGSPELTVDASAEERKPPGTYRKRLQVVNLPPDIAAEIRPGWVLLTTTAPARPEGASRHR